MSVVAGNSLVYWRRWSANLLRQVSGVDAAVHGQGPHRTPVENVNSLSSGALSSQFFGTDVPDVPVCRVCRRRKQQKQLTPANMEQMQARMKAQILGEVHNMMQRQGALPVMPPPSQERKGEIPAPAPAPGSQPDAGFQKVIVDLEGMGFERTKIIAELHQVTSQPPSPPRLAGVCLSLCFV